MIYLSGLLILILVAAVLWAAWPILAGEPLDVEEDLNEEPR